MSGQAFVLVLAAAILHATWNTLVKSSSDRLVTTWAVACGGAVVNLPVLVIAGLPEPETLPWLIASAVIHVGYGYALAGAYDRVDLAAAYPIARGTAPLLVTIAGVALLGDSITIAGAAGVLLVTASLALIGLRHVPAGVGWAVLTGLMIALYTVADGAGVRAGDESVRYIAALFQLHAALFTVALGITRRSLRSVVDAALHNPKVLMLGGAASAGAYLLVMIAARTTPLGLVAGLRETSAGFGVAAGHLLLKETVTKQHMIAVAVALVGAVLIATS